MSSHYSQEELILAYYGEPQPAERREHLEACAECRAELGRLAQMLDQVTPVEVPEPAADYESRVWDRLSWRLPSERKRRVSSRWTKALAAAAMFALAFVAGLLFNRSNHTPAPQVAENRPSTKVEPTAVASTQQQRDRILLVVVGDHFDQSERVLVELTNLASNGDPVDITAERNRAEDLLASNRLYRRTATDRGEDQVATLLDELEPVLMQIAHGPTQMTPDELQRIQKRVETKGLVFKLRVLRADVRATSTPHLQQQPTT
jgi:hypothetical protein